VSTGLFFANFKDYSLDSETNSIGLEQLCSWANEGRGFLTVVLSFSTGSMLTVFSTLITKSRDFLLFATQKKKQSQS
jgi:hypothetical protein